MDVFLKRIDLRRITATKALGGRQWLEERIFERFFVKNNTPPQTVARFGARAKAPENQIRHVNAFQRQHVAADQYGKEWRTSLGLHHFCGAV